LPKEFKDRRALKKRLKRLAPKVPDHTCPDIDFVIDKIDNWAHQRKIPTKRSLEIMKKKLERLRSQNDALRDSGRYWYEKMCSYVFDE
jgi:hypothetical protein